MPYGISNSQSDCSGWATVKKTGNGYETIGCHKSKVDAIDQMVAVSLSEKIEPLGQVGRSVRADSYEPTGEMRMEARRGLAWRDEFNRGGTAVGVARARDISNGRALSLDTVKRMVSYFARHEIDKQAEGWSPGEDGYPSAGRIAWALWGGDPGRAWAERIADRARADEERYNPNQPRDEDGQWTSSGGGGWGDDDDADFTSITSERPGTHEYARQVDTEIARQQRDYASSLDPSVKQAVSDYTGEGYRDVGKALRGAPPPPLEGEELADATRMGMVVHEAARKAPPLQQSVIVYRGVSADAVGGSLSPTDLVGSTFTDMGVMSTSLSSEQASRFGQVIAIKVPAGTRALSVRTLSSQVRPEYELIFPAGRSFTITGTDGDMLTAEMG